jgi:DNA invertase Pin-like site-specific DNA recombinase
MKQIAVYCRTAQKNPEAIKLQKKQVLTFLKDQKNLGKCPDDVIFFEDDGYSGLNSERPGFQSLEDELKKGHVRAVVTTDLDRVSRSISLICEFISSLEKKGVRLLSIRGECNLPPRAFSSPQSKRLPIGLEK